MHFDSIHFAKPTRAILFILIVSFGFSSCGLALSRKATPEAKATVIAVATNYLGAVVAGDERSIAHMIDWPTYMGDGDDRITREDYLAQLRNIQQRWSNDIHPLMGLRIVDVQVREDDALVEFERPSKTLPAEIPSVGTIEIHLIWNGNGWIVRADSLFGKDKLFSRLSPKQVTPASKK